MKKYLFTSAAALAFCGLFTSCTHDLGYDESSAQNSVVKTYEQAFVTAFGQPDPNNEWGFGTSTAKAATRTITVPGTNDTYDTFNFPTTEEKAAAFPGTVPSNADEISNLTTIYNSSDLYAIYKGREDNHNYVITTTGEVEIGGSWDNKEWINNEVGTVMRSYNVYVNIGNNNSVTLKRNGTERMNLFIISGNVTLGSRNGKEFGEFGGMISVAEGATLTIPGTHLAHNDGIKVYNKGTINFTREAGFDIGNKCTFYSEGTTTSTGPLSYSPGANNASYFINFGDDAELTAPSMTLNSECHFFTDGTVTIAGETAVTQSGITWINNGHYTTNTMRFSAGNATFYNYCQLKVTNECKFLDGQFNLMSNSYAEIGRGLFNNFIVNMANNSGINIKNGSKWGRQAQGTFQGFRAKNDAATVYVRLGGQTSVPSHNGGAFHVQGANLTLAYESIKFYNGFYNEIGQYSNWDGITYSEETTAEQLASNNDGRITWDIHNVTKFVTGDDFAKVGFTVTEGQCSATWHGDDPDPDPNILRIICEDLSVKESTDWDFNDVVFDIQLVENNQAEITLLAAGGTLPLYIGDEDHEVHDLFAAVPENSNKGITRSTMINTGSTGNKYNLRNCKEAIFRLDILSDWTAGAGPSTSEEDLLKIVAKNLPVKVLKLVSGEKRWVTLPCEPGLATAKVAVNGGKNGFEWCDERVHINEKYKDYDQYGNEYGGFSLFVQGFLNADNWHNYQGPLPLEMVQELLGH